MATLHVFRPDFTPLPGRRDERTQYAVEMVPVHELASVNLDDAIAEAKAAGFRLPIVGPLAPES